MRHARQLATGLAPVAAISNLGKHHKSPEGDLWDLFELFVYGQPRMTVAITGERLDLRLFIPGKWEPIFTLAETADRVPLPP
jgi:hypothetical protein